MTDLLEKLEIMAAWLKPGGPKPTEPMPPKYETIVQAIDEIRHLAAIARDVR